MHDHWSYPQTTLRLNVHDGQTGLIQNGIAHVFTSLRVGRHLKPSYRWKLELSYPRTFVPGNKIKLSFLGTFVLNIKISMELSFPNIDY